jgi:hypothetical protein
MVNPSILSEMRADASEMIGDFGRTFTFKKVRSESTPATLSIIGLLSAPMIATELDIGGLNQNAVFEIRIPSNSAIPSGWSAIKNWALIGRHLTIIGNDNEFRVTAVAPIEDSAWVSMKIEAADPMPS